MDEEQKNNLENNVVNEEVKEETVTEVSTEPATPVETPTEAPVDETQAPLEQLAAQAAQNSVPVEEPTTTPDVNSVNTEEKKKGNKIVPIICVIVLLAGICAGLYFCTDIFKGKDKDKENEEVQQPVQPSQVTPNPNMQAYRPVSNQYPTNMARPNMNMQPPVQNPGMVAPTYFQNRPVVNNVGVNNTNQ